MKKIILSTLLLGFVVLTGCYYDKEQELYPNNFNECNTTNLTYTNSIKDLVSSNCATSGCHVLGGTSPDLSTYAFLKNNISAVTNRAITIKDMPKPAGMSTCNINKLDTWIKAGMAE